ncbi:surface antigen [Roseiarcus fermentans]|uniref:Surface antigen n=2 Tax=Roseiarcus fermentans TaxID=1473586 RepID=A0A366EEX1_9HYPH|nr:surface antigen [Roseiarcus fermentans]
MLMAALAAPTLAGCGGFGFGDSSAPSASAPAVAPAPAAVASLPAGAAQAPAAPAPVAVASLPPAAGAAQVPAAPAPVPPSPASIPTGAALGGVLGGPVGASLTEADRQAAWEAQIAALDSGKPRSWRGGHGVFGSVEPGAETGAGCRGYAQTIYVAGRPNHGQGVACKLPEGGWKMTS